MRRLAEAVFAAILCVLAGAVYPEPPPFPDFAPKFLKAPKPGERRQKLPQIGGVQPSPEPEVESVGPQRPAERYARFWEAISPGLAEAGAGRLAAALEQVASLDVALPRLAEIQGIVTSQGTHILAATAGTEVSPALALAVIWAESAGDEAAVSRSGAMGLMQLMPDTASRFGVSEPFVPSQNIRGGVSYLDWLIARYDQDPVLVLAAYNAGEGAVQTHAGVPPFPETRDYVPKVLAAYSVARALCTSPPQFITDGCVFTTLAD